MVSQKEIALLARNAAMKTRQTNIGGCGPCAAAANSNFVLGGLSGTSKLGCGCGGKCGGKCGGCSKTIDGLAGFWDDVKPSIPWMLLAGVIAGFAGWKIGGVYCQAKKFVAAKKRRK